MSHSLNSPRPETLAEIEWVFGYGSLMWNPGFAHIDRKAAGLQGYHRAFCIYSHHYRGTPEHPGLVLGLDAGGRCDGVAFRIEAAARDGVIAYLNERELTGYAYRPAVVDLALEDGRIVSAYTFVTDPGHPQYAGDLGPERSAEMIMSAAGNSGLNRDYLMNTLDQLEAHGFRDPALHDLLARVRHLTGLLDQG
ncbi:MAG: gamma-glutamylcyclotransferase, partial [Kangiella sp.]|nr:gamma-glutamylcyclotransferase [Kangiella sp.]